MPSKKAILPADRIPFVKEDGRVRPEFYKYLISLQQQTDAASSGGAGGGTADNVVSATCAISFRLSSHLTLPVFGGIVTLPAIAPDHIQINAISPGGVVTALNHYTDLPDGGTLAYADWHDSIVQTITAQPGWSIEFVAYDAGSNPTASPFTITGLTIPAGVVSSIAGTDLFAQRWGNADRSVHAVIAADIACSNYPQTVSIISFDGSVYQLQGWYEVDAAGTITMGLEGAKEIFYPPAADTDWNLLAAIGAWQGNDTDGWSCGYLGVGPVAATAIPGIATSANFTVHGILKPLATDITDLLVTAPGAGSWPYNHIYDEATGGQDFLIPEISMDDSGAADSDPNAAFAVLIATDLDAAGDVIGPQQLYGSMAISPKGMGGPRIWGKLNGPYGSTGVGYDRTNPFPGGTPANVAAVRLELYLVSRLDPSEDSWKNPLCSTKQTGIGGGTGKVDVPVAAGGAPPTSISPDVSATDPIITFQTWAHKTVPVFSGTITYPTSDPLYGLIDYVAVFAIDPATSAQIEINRYPKPGSGSTLPYSGWRESIQQTGANQPGWKLRFVSYTSNGITSAGFETATFTIAAATIVSVVATDDTGSRWREALDRPLHAVVPVAIVCSNYPQTVTIWTDSPQYGRFLHISFILEAGGTFSIGAENTTTAIYPPTIADETVTVYVAIGYYDDTVDPTTITGVASTTVLVHAPPAPGTTAASGAYIDELIVNRATQQWGWRHLYATLPFDDPNFKAARWTVQNGHYTNPVDPSTFVAGNLATAQHQGKEVPFSDLGDNVYRLPGTNQVSIENNNPSMMWTIPDYRFADGNLNPDNVFRLKNLVATTRAQSSTDDATWAAQNDWASGIGVTTPGFSDYFDIVFDLSQGQLSGTNIDPATLGGGFDQDSQNRPRVKTGNGTELDGGGAVAAKLAALGGLQFDGSGNTLANIGYTMKLNSSGQIVLSNLPTSFGLPALPSASYPAGAVVLNTVDNKIYRNPTGSAWVKSSDPADLVAGAVATGVTIAAAQISTGTLAAGVVYAGAINASQVNAGGFAGRSLTISAVGTTTTIDNVSGYFGTAGVRLDNNASHYGVSLEDEGFVQYDVAGLVVVQCGISGGSGVVRVYKQSGSGAEVDTDGAYKLNGTTVLSDPGGLGATLDVSTVKSVQYKAGTASGVSGSFVAGTQTVTVTHGLITSIV